VIEQQGRIATLEGDHAWVEIGGQSGCPACDAGQGCGAGLFGKLLNRSKARVRVANVVHARPGEGVVLGIDEGLYLRLVLKLYGLPLVTGLIGAGLAFALASALAATPASASASFSPGAADLVTALGGLVAAALTLRVTRRRLPAGFTHLSPVLLDTSDELDCNSANGHAQGING